MSGASRIPFDGYERPSAAASVRLADVELDVAGRRAVELERRGVVPVLEVRPEGGDALR
jgi:hypothetical protein